MNNLKTTIRCNQETKDAYEEVYSSFYYGAKTAAQVFPTLRIYALQQLQKEITPEEFEIAEKLIPDTYLKHTLMMDPVLMMRAITMQQEKHRLDIDFQHFKIKIGGLDPIHLYFMFSEIKRYREIKKEVPGYDAKEYFKSEML
jgi:hypothetical protein